MNTDRVISDVKDMIGQLKKSFLETIKRSGCGVLVLKKIPEKDEDYFHCIPIIFGSDCCSGRIAHLREDCQKMVLALCESAKKHGHISSHTGQGRPGAIVADGWVYGFAGFSDHMNEILVVEAAAKQGALNYEDISTIFGISQNKRKR